ncbi:host attachment protein [Maritalea mediterranea]|uniref:Host attachment protein n=1 Tax=Maritalea mediterranea TaxID=2909667 RepID=A0ABS9E9S1_9HYPH|nr:host attachment protein [Maritalea mediterranea]MCF4098947.1 host attachment protein [Maritalea mediterranea]
MKPTITWLLVANGTEAKIFENTGPNKGLTPLTDQGRQREALKTSEIVANDRGRTFTSAGDGRSAMEQQTDPDDVEHEKFSREVADHLNRAAQENKFDRLIIAAPPKSLGEMRQHFNKHLEQKLEDDVPKDLTNIPTADLPDYFKNMVVF